MSLRNIAAYVGLVIPSLLIVALLWSLCISDRLYHCWDDVPIMGFIPPFVHDVPPLANGDHDHYIAAPWIVYSVWAAFLAAALWLPIHIIRLRLFLLALATSVFAIWGSVGSANFDNRSVFLNEEANLNVLDKEWDEAHARVFDEAATLFRQQM
jgi:hypothetical protein